MKVERSPRWLDRVVPIALVAIPVAMLARATAAAVLRKVGHAGPTLDDAYIHFHYARAFVEGHPLRYQPGEPVTGGSTSLLWPAVLAPFWALGLRDTSLVWAAWALSFAALGALAWEVKILAEPLAGRACAIAAGAMVLASPALTWSAASGMEVVPFAWALARAMRRGAEWAEDDARRTPARRWELVGLAAVAALLRPEGALAALAIAAALAAFPAGGRRVDRAWSGAAALSALLPFLVMKLATGGARGSTAQVKLLFGNPYYAGGAFWDAVLANARVLFGTLLDGEVWSAEFIPTGMGPLFVAGAACVVVQGVRTRRWARAAGVLLVAAMMLVPCTYVTFLWNRLRYLWPFLPGWLIGLACLARCAGDLVAQLDARLRVVAPMAAGAFAGALATHLPWAIDDVAGSASGIDRQQVALGRWAREHLPKDARVGVNDTGAIAYFSERRTFDVVGLTTAGEGRYWVAGAGSRLEHYERLHRERAASLPTHFIVYPEWMACDAVLGAPLHEALVTDASILGGQVMRVYEADYSLLGSGEQPWTASPAPVDALDVADLESEAEHRYDLLGARDNTEIARTGASPAGAAVVDGGRGWRTSDRFVARLPARPISALVRIEAAARVAVELSADGRVVDRKELEPGEWTELELSLPADAAKPETAIELRARGGVVTTYHYWFVPRGETAARQVR